MACERRAGAFAGGSWNNSWDAAAGTRAFAEVPKLTTLGSLLRQLKEEI
jgi:hypothetical protein